MLVLLAAGPALGEYYSVSGGGAQLEIGDAQMPLQPSVGTGLVLPPLLIPPNQNPAKALVQQTPGPDPKQIAIPPGVFLRPAPGPNQIGARPRNQRMFQIQTNISFSAPGAAFGSAVFKAGGRTGKATATFPGTPLGSRAIYQKTAAQFGGPAQIAIAPATRVRVWAGGAKIPCKHTVFGGADFQCFGVVVPAYPAPLAAPGAKAGFIAMTPGGPPSMSRYFGFSVPNATGLVAQSLTLMNLPTAMQTNKAVSVGFPWTTGRISLSAPGALGGKENFKITGMDSRVSGSGMMTLVSGALSKRAYTGPNANRGWMLLTVPEPDASIGAAAAFAALAAIQRIASRRAR